MDRINKIYKECPLKYSFVYPRYISDCHPRDVCSSDVNFDGRFNFPDDFVFVNRKDELWYQKSKLTNKTVVPDNDLEVFKTEDGKEVLNYIYNQETYIHNVDNSEIHYLNTLLDDQSCLIHRSCGSLIGNTNTKERYTEMSSVEIDGEKYTVTMKKIWGFEPDLAESYEDISNGIINGFSKKEYTLFVKYNDEKNINEYIPTVDNQLLNSTQIQEIIGDNYPNKEAGVLLVSD